jgi:hypothetical protein
MPNPSTKCEKTKKETVWNISIIPVGALYVYMEKTVNGNDR